MSTPIEVRRARPEEFAAVADLTAGVFEREGWASGSYLSVLRDVAARAAVADVLVALDDGRVVGAVAVTTRPGAFAEHAVEGESVMRMLVADPAVRGRGVGAALVQACLDTAVGAGCVRLRLSTQPAMAAAHRLYERFGFVRTPELDWSPEPGVDLVTYALELPRVCDQCGQPGVHPACRAAAALDPPRWCGLCGRRMVVQVTPTGWSARCVEHGLRAG